MIAAIFLTKATPGMSLGQEWQVVASGVVAWKLNSTTGALFVCGWEAQSIRCYAVK